jgi:hypothetical protein
MIGQHIAYLYSSFSWLVASSLHSAFYSPAVEMLLDQKEWRICLVYHSTIGLHQNNLKIKLN